METRNSLPKKLILFVLSAAVIGLTAMSLWAYDRIGQLPFCELWTPDIDSITIRYSSFEPYELSQMEMSEFTHTLSYIRVGLPVVQSKIFSPVGHVFYTIKTNGRSRTFQFDCDGFTHISTDYPHSYLAYVIIDGVRYNCYDRALIKTLEALEDKYIEAMEAAE